jgi:5-methylcytosine-specific restriction endonuclease McrA
MKTPRIIARMYQQFRRAAFPEEWYAQAKRYRGAHPNRVRACKKRCRLSKPDHYRAKGREYRATRYAYERKACIGDRTAIAAIYNRAVELCQWFNVEVDHIIPLAKGGAHASNNLQIIYAHENRRKNDSLNFYMSDPASISTVTTTSESTPQPRTWRHLTLSLLGIIIILIMWRWSVGHLYMLPAHSIAAFTSITTNAFYTISAILIFLITGHLLYNWSNATTAATTVASEVKESCERKIDPKDIPGADNVH